MTKLDTFESVFKSADKPVYAYRRVELGRVLLVTDLSDAEAGEADARRPNSQDLAGVQMTHDGELDQVDGAAIDVGAHVQPNGEPFQVGDHRAQGRPLDPL